MDAELAEGWEISGWSPAKEGMGLFLPVGKQGLEEHLRRACGEHDPSSACEWCSVTESKMMGGQGNLVVKLRQG